MMKLREHIGSVLYEREKERGERAASVVRAAGDNGRAIEMEPWDECKEMFLGDADAVIAMLAIWLTEVDSK